MLTARSGAFFLRASQDMAGLMESVGSRTLAFPPLLQRPPLRNWKRDKSEAAQGQARVSQGRLV